MKFFRMASRNVLKKHSRSSLVLALGCPGPLPSVYCHIRPLMLVVKLKIQGLVTVCLEILMLVFILINTCRYSHLNQSQGEQMTTLNLYKWLVPTGFIPACCTVLHAHICTCLLLEERSHMPLLEPHGISS